MKGPAADKMGKAGSIAGYVAGQRPKVFVAAGLIALMIFMWVRLLTKKGAPGVVNAAGSGQTAVIAGGNTAASQKEIEFIELPEIEGRNDVLNRDFFAARKWDDNNSDPDVENLKRVKELYSQTEDDTESSRRKKAVLRLAQELTLEAIVVGRNAEAFIENTLVSVGDKLQVEDKGDLYEFDVVEISDNEVVVMCEGVRVEMKMLHEGGSVD